LYFIPIRGGIELTLIPRDQEVWAGTKSIIAAAMHFGGAPCGWQIGPKKSGSVLSGVWFFLRIPAHPPFGLTLPDIQRRVARRR